MPTTTTILTTSETPQLIKKQIKILKKFGRYFNCKRKGHMASSCTQLVRFYSAVSDQLQKVMLLKDTASNLKKD